VAPASRIAAATGRAPTEGQHVGAGRSSRRKSGSASCLQRLQGHGLALRLLWLPR
jgi:hypothetical protein